MTEREVKEISEDQAQRLLRQYARTKDPEVRDRIVSQFSSLVESIARGFSGSGEPTEDLVQEGYVGLLKAIDMYDPNRGVKFITYATHLILGEIKHYLRDRKTLIREPGWLYELNQKVSRTIDTLTQKLGRYPTVSEIAREANIEEEAVMEVLRTRSIFKISSLNGAVEEDEAPRPQIDSEKLKSLQQVSFELPIEDKIVLDQAIEKLKDIERQVIEYFFYRDLSQTEIARRLGVSCNYVSHLVRMSLRKLRGALAREEQKEAALRLRQAIKQKQEYFDAIEKRGVRDELTGLYNSAYFMERLREEVLRAQRYSHELALMVVDVDGLARFNRQHTLAAGDEALRRIAQIIRSNVRKIDILARAAPGAFGVILPQTGDVARRVAERILRRISQARIGATGPRSKILTARAGIAVFPLDAEDDEQLIDAALAAADEARNRGGNCVVMVSEIRPREQVEPSIDATSVAETSPS